MRLGIHHPLATLDAMPVQQACRFRLGQIKMLECQLELWSLSCHSGLLS
jgi:hypothetical protein